MIAILILAVIRGVPRSLYIIDFSNKSKVLYLYSFLSVAAPV